MIKFSELSFLSFVDEAVALSSYILAPFFLRKKSDSWIYLILSLPLVSSLYGLITGYFFWGEIQLYEVVVQSFINFKLFLYFVIFYCFYRYNHLKSRHFEYVFLACFFISVLGAFVNLSNPGYFLYSEYEYEISRQRLIGFQFKPNDLAILMSFYALYLLFSGLRGFRTIVFLFCIFLIIYSTSRTALGIFLVGGVSFIFWKRKYSYIAIASIIGLIALPFFIEALTQNFFVTETISNISQFANVNLSQYIRVIMVYYGFVLGFDFFPIGAGPGTFGTVMSANSPAYDALGLSSMRFFQEMSGVYDSNLASIIGEYGFLGLIVFFVLYARIIKCILGDRRVVLWLFVSLAIVMISSQPLFGYQVNSINLLLLLFCMSPIFNTGDQKSLGGITT